MVVKMMPTKCSIARKYSLNDFLLAFISGTANLMVIILIELETHNPKSNEKYEKSNVNKIQNMNNVNISTMKFLL